MAKVVDDPAIKVLRWAGVKPADHQLNELVLRNHLDPAQIEATLELAKGCGGDLDALHAALEREVVSFSPKDPRFDAFVPMARELYESVGEPLSKLNRSYAASQEHTVERDLCALAYHLWFSVLGKTEQPDGCDDLAVTLMEELEAHSLFEVGARGGGDVRLFRSLGASVVGCDINPDRSSRTVVDEPPAVLQGPAQDFLRNWPQGEISILYSVNVFCRGAIERDDAIAICKAAHGALRDDGMMMHQIHFEPISLKATLLCRWIEAVARHERAGKAHSNESFRDHATAVLVAQDAMKPLNVSNFPVLTPAEYRKLGFDLSVRYHDSVLTFLCRKDGDAK